MSSLIDVAEEQRAPLLRQSSAPSSTPNCPDDDGSGLKHVNQNQQRLDSLDVFRGLTVAVPPNSYNIPLLIQFTEFRKYGAENWNIILII